MSKETVSQNRIKKLDKIASKELQDVCNELRATGRVSFEEENIDVIIDFIDNE